MEIIFISNSESSAHYTESYDICQNGELLFKKTFSVNCIIPSGLKEEKKKKKKKKKKKSIQGQKEITMGQLFLFVLIQYNT